MSKTVRCIIVDDEYTARDVLKNHLSRIKNTQIIASCKNAVEAFNVISNESIDLVFLDINMPEISGLSFAKSINKDIKIIFTTAYREYAVDGFDLQAVDYLLKPISFERLHQAITKYLNETVVVLSNQSDEPNDLNNEFIFVRSDRKMVKIDFNDILYIESLGDYIKIHLDNKVVVSRETISNIEAKLPQNKFVRIHRSFIVSILAIDSYTNEDIEIRGKELPISRSYKEMVMKKLNKDNR